MKKVKYARIHNYDRTGNLKQDGTAQIYIRAYLQAKNKFFPTGICVTPKQWDKKNRRIVNHPYQVRFNQLLSELETKLEAFELKVFQREGNISLDRLGDYKNENIDISFTDFYLQELENPQLTHQSFTDQRQTLQKLQAFRQTIYFNELNYRLISRFDTFLHGLKLHTNTIAKHHKNLKKYINQAIKFDYLDVNNNPYKRFKVKTEPTERIFLTESELNEMEQLTFNAESQQLEMIRDFFLFCSWTGLRYSDASTVIGNSFHQTDDGLILFLTAKKTKKPHRLNLSKLFGGKPEQLIRKYLDKYDDFYFDDPDNPMPIFFRLTNQYINRELKTIAKRLNVRPIVKKEISCHIARHTFGTIMAGKVAIHHLQRLMQHSKIKETMIYVHLNNSMMDDALDQVKW